MTFLYNKNKIEIIKKFLNNKKRGIMIQYKCKSCKIFGRSSKCDICGAEAERSSVIYWCEYCKIPIYEEECSLCHQRGRPLTKDIRPVFPEERLLVEIVRGKPFEFLKESVWNGAGNHYFINGKRISFSISKLRDCNADWIREEYNRLAQENTDIYFKSQMELWVKANQRRLEEIEKEAISYIRETCKTYDRRDLLVSFSGGKDSTVTSDLVLRAFHTAQIAHIFGDTTLEFPQTLDYLERFRREHPKLLVMTAENKEKDFMELCRLVGPPSRVMRWCCTVFKTGAITRKIEAMFRGKTHIVTFYGIRRSESIARKKYKRETDSPKITKQTVISPIIDWYDFDVWLYLFTRKIDFNDAYRLGYTRVGCWCCPNNSVWSEFLSRVHMAEQYQKFRKLLLEFAVQIGKPDPVQYVDGGFWKARQGGNGMVYAQKSVISFEACATEDHTFRYQLQRPISEEFYELFKPFGKLNFSLGNARLGEVYVLDQRGEIVLKLAGRKGSDQLKATIYKNTIAGAKSWKAAEEKIKCQITKYQMCMGCKACVSVCRHSAIRISDREGEGVRYQIEDQICVRCGECVGHFTAGCYMRKVLSIKR